MKTEAGVQSTDLTFAIIQNQFVARSKTSTDATLMRARDLDRGKKREQHKYGKFSEAFSHFDVYTGKYDIIRDNFQLKIRHRIILSSRIADKANKNTYLYLSSINK